MAKYIAGRQTRHNNVNTGNAPKYVYFANAPTPNKKQVICGVNCNCPKQRKSASEKAVPGYDYLKSLGNGGFGYKAVHLYRDRETRKTVAIKCLSYVSGTGENIFHEVSSEYDIVIHINHPNITKYYKFFTNSQLEKCYIVMEYASRGSLRKFITDRAEKKQLFHQYIVLRIIRDIIKGVQFLNSQHVVHCDLKPENILVGDDNRMKICDFGTAHFDYDINATLAFTWSYMAPEQFDKVRPNEKTELWAIGIILYELCALRHPFESATSTADLVSKIRLGRFPPLNSYYGFDLKYLLESMLHVDPEYRYSLKNILNNELFQF